jgi:hypothetical protein
MKNYLITEIKDFKNKSLYPDANLTEVKNRFKSLEEYWKIAKKAIQTFGPMFISHKQVKHLLNSEDAISEVARFLMMGDWRYNPNKKKTEYSYRNQCGKWAVMDYLRTSKTQANRNNLSLDSNMSDEDGDIVSLLDVIENKLVENPLLTAQNNERKLNIQKYIKYLLKNSDLTYIQKKCIEMYYLQGIENAASIGKAFNPRISRQAVKQNIDTGISKLKQLALGTGSKKENL